MTQASLSAAPPPLLALENLEVLYAGVILALKGVNLQVADGGCTALLGPNGAGKSSMLKAISGMLAVEEGEVTAGSVRYAGEDLAGQDVQRRVAAGIVHVVEGRKVLRHMSVEQNLVVGGHVRPNLLAMRRGIEEVYETIPRLKDLRTRTAGYLSGGEQQLLLIGRAVMSSPRLLIIDEPSLGLAPLLIEEVFGLLARLRSRGLSLLIVEQNAHAALAMADHGYVLEGGRVVLEGTSEQLRANEDIQEFYLGRGAGGERRNYREIKHYRRRKRWLG